MLSLILRKREMGQVLTPADKQVLLSRFENRLQEDVENDEKMVKRK